MRKLARVHVEREVKASGGKFFGVTFEKKDKTLRTMNARLGVVKFLKGGENKTVKSSNSYMTVWDKHKASYRTLNLATIKELHVNGEKFQVID